MIFIVREFKFRGKSLEDNKWNYGSFVNNTQCDFDCYISCDNGNLIKADRETVSQYTGLKDKNGVEIYENDIVKSKDWNKGKEYIYIGKIKFLAPNFKVVGVGKYYGMNYDLHSLSEMIGNIYENPELLK